MKPFRLPLQVLRTLREQKEQAAQLAHAEALRNREIARERHHVASRQLDDAWAQVRTGRACGALAVDLQRARLWCDVLVEHRRELEIALQLAQVNVEKSLRALRLAQRARETITRYQKRKQQAHVREVQRLEQKELDEAGTRLAVLGSTFASA